MWGLQGSYDSQKMWNKPSRTMQSYIAYSAPVEIEYSDFKMWFKQQKWSKSTWNAI